MSNTSVTELVSLSTEHARLTRTKDELDRDIFQLETQKEEQEAHRRRVSQRIQAIEDEINRRWKPTEPTEPKNPPT